MRGMMTPDLILETMGRYWICLRMQPSPHLSPVENQLPESAIFSTSSISFLIKLLKVDMGNVFIQNGPTPLILQPKLNTTQLKVLTCEECAPLIKKLEVLYRQLEKLEMSVESHLSLVHAKLVEAEEESDVVGLMNELQTLSAIRTEVINKCSLKLRCSEPRVKLERLSQGKVSEERLKRSFSPRVTDVPELLEAVIPPNMIKTEMSVTSDQELGEDNENRRDDTYPAEQDNKGAELNVSFSNSDWDQKVFTDPANQAKNTNADIKPSQRKTPVLKSKDEQTCPVCLKKFHNGSSLARHSKSIHQKLREHSCTKCGKKFRGIYDLREHHRIVHNGIAPKCLKCHKAFSSKWSLSKHRKNTSCIIQPKLPRKPGHSKTYRHCCHVCKNKFKSPSDLKRHFNSVHLKLKMYACHLCKSKFARKDHLIKHQLRKHSNVPEGSTNNRKKSTTAELVLGP